MAIDCRHQLIAMVAVCLYFYPLSNIVDLYSLGLYSSEPDFRIYHYMS